MAAIPITHHETTALAPRVAPKPATDWTQFVAAGTLLAGGALLITGHKKAGLAAAAAGTAIAIIDQQEVVKKWWLNLPAYLREAQTLLDKVEGYMEEAAVQGHKIQSILRR